MDGSRWRSVLVLQTIECRVHTYLEPIPIFIGACVHLRRLKSLFCWWVSETDRFESGPTSLLPELALINSIRRLFDSIWHHFDFGWLAFCCVNTVVGRALGNSTCVAVSFRGAVNICNATRKDALRQKSWPKTAEILNSRWGGVRLRSMSTRHCVPLEQLVASSWGKTRILRDHCQVAAKMNHSMA